jgi:hypothetical protein
LGLQVRHAMRAAVSLVTLVGMTAGVAAAHEPVPGPATLVPNVHTMGHLAGTAQVTGTTYFVDCESGSDGNGGTAESQAWRTVDRANRAALAPGDGLLFRRGCTWAGPLLADWNGTPDNPVTIGAYGAGDQPALYNSRDTDEVRIGGSYQLIQDLQASADAPWRDPNCANQPVGWRAGFALYGDHNTLQNVKASALTVGVFITGNANRVLYSWLADNVNLSQNSNNGAADDSGAWGIALHGDDNEIAYNHFSGNNAWCSYDFGQDGAAVEVYGAHDNAIHHNVSQDDTTFSELGDGAGGNTFAYNQYVDTSHYRSEFLTLRGTGNQAYNNSVYLTGGDSRGLTVDGDPATVVRNNILYVEGHAAYASGPIVESNNIYWTHAYDPPVNFVGFGMSPTSQIADPQFVDPGAGNLRLQESSPARDAGSPDVVLLGYGQDLAGGSIPAGPPLDIGAYEYGAAPAGKLPKFPDSPPDDLARAAIGQLTARGLVRGNDDGRTRAVGTAPISSWSRRTASSRST